MEKDCGVGLGLGVAVGISVGVGVAVGVGVEDGMGVAVDVGVGVAANIGPIPQLSRNSILVANMIVSDVLFLGCIVLLRLSRALPAAA